MHSPLVILFLSAQYPPTVWDGGGTYVHQAAHALVELGHEVHVLSCLRGQSDSDSRDGEVFVHRRGMVVDGQFMSLRLKPVIGKVIRGMEKLTHSRAYPNDAVLWRLSQAVSYWREYRRLGLTVDVAEAQGSDALLFSARRELPVLGHLHGPGMLVPRLLNQMSLRGHVADGLDRYTARRADLLTAPSKLIADHLNEVTGWLGGREAMVVPHPYRPPRELIDAPPVDTSDPLVLAIGRVEKMKGFDLLAETFPALREAVPEARVRIIGQSYGRVDGRRFDHAIRDRAQLAGIDCALPGPLPHQQVLREYAAARVVVIPSRFDNAPMVGLEAMAAGRPVICSDRVGYADLITKYDAGTVVPVGDTGALADAIIRFLLDPEDAAEAGQRGRLLIDEQFAPMAVVRQRDAALRQTISRWRRDTSNSP